MGDYKTIEYTLELDMPGGGYPAFAAAEQEVRTLTYHPGQQDTADQLFQVPPDPVHSVAPAVGPWEGAEAVSLNALRPRGLSGVYILGGCADVSREQAEKLMRPLALIDLGRRVGAAAAAEAAARGALESVKLPGQETLSPGATGDVREPLDWHRPTASSDLSVVEQEARAVPVLGEYDVVVIGGGTSGAPAGIAAARQGARVLVVEYLHMLGGTGTAGHIVRYYHGNRVGFSAEVLGGASRWELEQRAEWWRSKLIEAGGEVWFGALGVGAFVEDDTVRGAVVVTPWQRGVVLADVVIDATGRSAVAAAAGAEIEYTDASTVAVQGTGLSVLRPGVSYANSDFTITDDTDIVDASQVFVYAKHKYPRAYDQAKLITTRERPRIVGDARITVRDQLMGRSYPDTVVRAQSDFDSHGYTIDPYFFVEHPGRARIRADIPYRAMLPQGLEGILVVGLGISAQRDALPAIRMQPDIQNGGYAAGVAASMAADSGLGLREIDVRALQRRLVAVGNLPKGVLEHEDSYPLPPEKIAAAVAALPRANDFRSAASVLAHPEQALPLLKDAYAGAEGAAKLSYAKVLAIIGDSAGLDTLIGQVQSAVQWDDGWDYQGAAQYDAAHSELDELIIALGKTAKPEAVPTILDKVELLTADHEFSHHRAAGLALELIADPAASEPLARLLDKPDMSGKHHPDIAAAIEREVNQPGGMNAVTTRRESLRELLLARALYRCGDHDGIGRQILENYTTDLRGHLARHAKAVLADE